METIKCLVCGEIKDITNFTQPRIKRCRECVRVCNARYRETHQEQLHQYDRNRYAKNPEIKQASSKKRRAVSREEVNAGNRKYYAEHPEYAKRATERWRKRHAIKLNAGGTGITNDQWLELKEQYFHRCAYCNQKKFLTVDHIIPLSGGGKHEVENIVPSCKPCNCSKQAHSLLVFLYRRRIA
jgi:5-methylcytosine-specific restriction endonuclease McrA